VLASNPFNLLPREIYIGLVLVSLISTYRFFYNFKSYDIFDFEDLYGELKTKSKA
jgi:hypothetical protein